MITTRMGLKYYVALMITLSLVWNTAALAQVDQNAPQISNVQITGVTEGAVTITWNTDENADSLVNYGLQPDYGILRKPVADRKAHTMTLENLEPGRVYYFRVVSADASGNQGISADYRVQTSGTSGNGEGQSSSTETPQEIIEQIKQARESGFISFGSCSFDEPREDLQKLGLLT